MKCQPRVRAKTAEREWRRDVFRRVTLFVVASGELMRNIQRAIPGSTLSLNLLKTRKWQALVVVPAPFTIVRQPKYTSICHSGTGGTPVVALIRALRKWRDDV